jgi:hypothetical protein
MMHNPQTNITTHPASPMIKLSTHLSAPPFVNLELPPPLLASPAPLLPPPPPIPLQTKSPTPRAVAEVELARVVLALLLAGPLAIVLVWPLTTSAVPCSSRLYVVPLSVSTSPGRRVVPDAMANSVVPSRMEAVYVFPLIVNAGAAVTRLLLLL